MRHWIRWVFYLGLALPWAGGFLWGCKGVTQNKPNPLPLKGQVTWDGSPPIEYAVDSIQAMHAFTFLGMDSLFLKLQEFPHAYLAYAAYTQRATLQELKEGFYREKGTLFFFHDRFLAELQYAHSGLIPAHFLKTNLEFKGQELFLIPPEFQAFPSMGRIAKSERVHIATFLGQVLNKPAFSTQFHCHEDTAMAFRILDPDSTQRQIKASWKGKSDTLDWGREIRFQGQNEMREPLLFWSFSEGILGILGCFDPQMALAYAQKIKKMTVLIPKL